MTPNGLDHQGSNNNDTVPTAVKQLNVVPNTATTVRTAPPPPVIVAPAVNDSDDDDDDVPDDDSLLSLPPQPEVVPVLPQPSVPIINNDNHLKKKKKMENKTTTAKVIPQQHHHHVFSSNRSVTSIRSETRVTTTTASSYYSAANNNNRVTTSSASSVRSTARPRVNNASTPPRIKSTGGHYYNNNTKNPTIRTDDNDNNAATNDFSIGLYCLANMMRTNTDDDNNMTCYKGSCHCGAIQFELLLPTNNNNNNNSKDYSKKEEGEQEEENKKDATTTTASTTTAADADIVIQRSTEQDAERDKIWYRYIKVKITHFEIIQGQDSLTTYYHVKETLMAPRPKTRYYIPTKTTTHQAGCARAFCKHCGVFILYAPSKNSPVMHINANCIPALNNNGPTSSSSSATTLIATTARNKMDLYVSTASKHWKELVQAGQTASTEVTSVVTNAAIEIREMIILSVLKGLKTWKSILDEE
eukprot:scaffold2566_cov52-Cylindrotheca_fusiformis.AAC.2